MAAVGLPLTRAAERLAVFLSASLFRVYSYLEGLFPYMHALFLLCDYTPVPTDPSLSS